MPILLILTFIFGSVSVSADTDLDSKVTDDFSISMNQAPWTASIHRMPGFGDETPFENFLCTGVIIGSNEILTAGHCFPQNFSTYKPISIRSGVIGKAGNVNYLDYVRFHPFYQEGHASYDFAFVRVETEFPVNENTEPILIGNTEPERGTTATVTGWGTANPEWGTGQTYPKKLRAANLTVWDTDDCYSKFNVSVSSANHPETLKCLKNIRVGSDASGCAGDIGSPVIYKGKLVGILTSRVSRETVSPTGVICSSPSAVNIYNSVSKIREWINEKWLDSKRDGFTNGPFGPLDGFTTGPF